MKSQAITLNENFMKHTIFLLFIIGTTIVSAHGQGVLPVTKDDVCTPGYSSHVRSVSSARKRQVFARDHVTYPSHFVVDHRVPLSLGGANTLENLQAQTFFRAHQKDVAESAALKLVCAGRLELRVAQDAFRKNRYKRFLKET